MRDHGVGIAVFRRTEVAAAPVRAVLCTSAINLLHLPGLHVRALIRRVHCCNARRPHRFSGITAHLWPVSRNQLRRSVILRSQPVPPLFFEPFLRWFLCGIMISACWLLKSDYGRLFLHLLYGLLFHLGHALKIQLHI